MFIDKQINEDKDFFGFKLRTRRHWYDDKIIRQCLNGDPYRIPKNSKVVIDIGANIGCVSLMAIKMGAEKIFSFEPCLENFEVLYHNIEVNGFKDRVTCINKGVGKSNKETRLFIHPSNSGAISAYKHNTGLTDDNYEMIEFISIHDVFGDYNIIHCDLLKMDCEGSEADIIRDFDDDLASRVEQISLEFHDKKIVGELVNILSKWYEPENTKRYEWIFYRREY